MPFIEPFSYVIKFEVFKYIIIFALVLPNKLLLYKAILKPIWTYGIQL
jgi:hypothetical protein